MKKMNLILRKCKTLSRQLGRSSSYSSLRSKSTRDDILWGDDCRDDAMQKGDSGTGAGNEKWETILVGSTRKRYMISSRYLNHPLLNALIQRSKQRHDDHAGEDDDDDDQEVILVKCEVVLFDHLLWMLENNHQNLLLDSLDELADLYLL